MHPISKMQVTLGKLFLISTLTACIYACGNDDASSQQNLPSPTIESIRTNKVLNDQNWKFILDNDHLDVNSASQKLSSSGSLVKLPHTWNANDAATTNATTDYHRGIGWYQLEFDHTPGSNANTWIQFDGASIVTEVWLNGEKLGDHGGAFTAFRFDISKHLKNGKNTLIIKCDNSKPLTGSDPTAIAPLGGDFNMAGGLYRGVSLISTPNLVSIALNDFGSTGVFVNTKNINNIRPSGGSLFGDTEIGIKTKLTNNSNQSGSYTIRTTLIGKDKKVAASSNKNLKIEALANAEVDQNISISGAHLWNGITDPYLYDLVVEVIDASGKVIDKSVQQYGIRQIKFDADNGFYLNGKSYRLNGVNVHQDALGKAWAISNSDVDERMSAVMDIGANAVRFAHYPYSDYAYTKADQLGLIVWAEAPFVNQALTGSQGRGGVVNGDCANTSKVPESFVENLIQQTKEMIRQSYNHPSIGMWSIANEVNTIALCQGKDTVTPILHTLNDLVHKEDSSRVTTLADMVQGRENNFPDYSRVGTGGITDVVGYNRYFGWYYNVVELINDLSVHLDELHTQFPKQPLAISEYGAGAAISHHSDNPLGGQTNNFDSSNGTEVNYQTEEYASYVHEQNYSTMLTKPYIWGTFIWNLFDFGSGVRNEGDVRGVNTKGLITTDHQIKKDPYYFYKANWRTDIPVIHITGRRYINRAYPLVDVKVYSNADNTTLSLNGKVFKTMSKDECHYTMTEIPNASKVTNTCIFKNISLGPGKNEILASGSLAGKVISDTVTWNLNENNISNINIAAGQITTGFQQKSTGLSFGSDNFFKGGFGRNLTPLGATDTNQDRTLASGFPDGDAAIWKSYRTGKDFEYSIPVPNGSYQIKLGFLEPLNTTTEGGRTFNVLENNNKIYSNLDILAVTGSYRKVLIKSFNVDVKNGVLKLHFQGVNGEAVVSNISIKKI